MQANGLTEDTQRQAVEHWTSWTLRIGVWLSAALMIAGLAVILFSGSIPVLTVQKISPEELFARLFSTSADGITLMFSGLMLLMLTPFLRVAAALIGFLVERDLTFVVVALVVLSMLLGELFFSLYIVG